MPIQEGGIIGNVLLDSGNAPKVPGPHDAQGPQFDHMVISSLRQQRDEALIHRDAHQAELEMQSKFHAGEVERYDRVVRACNSALHELEPDVPEEYAHTTGPIARTEQMATGQVMHRHPGGLGG